MLEMVELDEKNRRHTNAVYASDFKLHRTAQKGYSATSSDVLKFSRSAAVSDSKKGNGVTTGVEIDYDDGEEVQSIWQILHPIIMSCNRNMRPLLKKFGVANAHLSQFLQNFQSPLDLLHTYFQYSPKTFKFNMTSDISETQMPVNTLEGDESEDDDNDDPSSTECNNILGKLQDEKCHNLNLLKKKTI